MKAGTATAEKKNEYMLGNEKYLEEPEEICGYSCPLYRSPQICINCPKGKMERPPPEPQNHLNEAGSELRVGEACLG